MRYKKVWLVSLGLIVLGFAMTVGSFYLAGGNLEVFKMNSDAWYRVVHIEQ